MTAVSTLEAVGTTPLIELNAVRPAGVVIRERN